MTKKKKSGRPLGSKGSSFEAVHELPRCGNCGGTDLKAAWKKERETVAARPIMHQGVKIHVRHTSKVWRGMRCNFCGANTTMYSWPYNPEKWPPHREDGNPPANGKHEDE